MTGTTPDPPDRPELGALLYRLTRAVLARERLLLAEHDLEMWDYVVLATLSRSSAAKQADLAAAVERDQTRLIPTLDKLAERGMLLRSRDPRDRRVNIVRLTAKGRRMTDRCRQQIRAMEDDLSAGLSSAQRRALYDALVRLLPARPPG